MHVNTLSFNSVLFYFFAGLSVNSVMLRLCVRQLRIQIPPRMQFSVHKKGWMDEKGIFLLLFIFGKSFERSQLFSAGIVRIVTSFVPFNRHCHFPYWRLAIRRTLILEQIEVDQAKFLSKMLQKMEFGFRLAERNLSYHEKA